MHESDLAVVSKLALLANPHLTEEKAREYILDEMKENPGLSLIATDAGEIVGYTVSDMHNDEEAVLEDIVVAKNRQRNGMGSLLLTKTIDVLRQRKVQTVTAEVHYKCAAAIPFYYRHGFRISGFKRDHFGLGHDAVIMKLVLSP
jgi:ribosomal protein S18 acetylase RimI-like enzyme